MLLKIQKYFETQCNNLDIWREEVAVRSQGSIEAFGAEGHPVSLHVTGGVAQLLADAFVDVGLQDVVPKLNGSI